MSASFGTSAAAFFSRAIPSGFDPGPASMACGMRLLRYNTENAVHKTTGGLAECSASTRAAGSISSALAQGSPASCPKQTTARTSTPNSFRIIIQHTRVTISPCPAPCSPRASAWPSSPGPPPAPPTSLSRSTRSIWAPTKAAPSRISTATAGPTSSPARTGTRALVPVLAGDDVGPAVAVDIRDGAAFVGAQIERVLLERDVGGAGGGPGEDGQAEARGEQGAGHGEIVTRVCWMIMRKLFGVLVLAVVCLGQEAGDPWAKAELMEPAALVEALHSAKPPVVLCTAFSVLYRSKRIPHAIEAGPGSKPEGIALLKKAAADVPKDADIVLYCGCCPMVKCPNIRPAYRALREMGFQHVRVLNIPTNMHEDWFGKGDPSEWPRSGSWKIRARSKTHRKLLKARPGGLRGRRRPRACPTAGFSSLFVGRRPILTDRRPAPRHS